MIEATTVTGPAKNLIQFCKTARQSHESDAGTPVIDPLIITYARGSKGTTTAFLDTLEAAGIRWQVIPERFRFDPSVFAELRRCVAGYSPDLVQTHSVKSHFLVRLAGLDRRYPWIGFHHGYTFTDQKMELYNRLDHWSLPHACRIVTVCKPFAEQMIGRGISPSKITILHNSVCLPGVVNPDEVTALRRKLGIENGEPVVLTVGRFSREKGHIDLIEAIAHLRQASERPFRLLLVGDGPERSNLVARIASLGLRETVVFAGHVPNVTPFYALASVMALPSHTEGSPNVVLEAMAHGVPIAATAVGGVPEILQHRENGLLAPARDSKAMADAIDRLLADRALAERLALSGRARVQQFTPEAYRRAMLRVYQAALDFWRTSRTSTANY